MSRGTRAHPGQRVSPRAIPPVLGEPVPLRVPAVHRATLTNGLEVFVVERRELPVVDVQVVVRSGAAYDPPALAGRACLTASLLTEGTAARSALDVAQDAELIGASIHSHASWDYSAAAVHVLTPRLDPALELLADVTLRPAFRDDDVRRRQHERLHAIRQDLDEPRVVASQAFAAVLYGPDHPYGTPATGLAATVERLTAGELRSCYDASFRADDAFIVVCGDVDARTLVPQLDALFGSWQTGAPPRRDPPAITDVPAGIHIVDRPGALQSELRVGHTGPPRSTEDYHTLHVLNTVLGGAFTSRLNILLREVKAYTYGAGTSFAFRRHGGPVLASTAVATAATADAVHDIVSELRRLTEEPVPEGELARAQRYIVLGLPRTFETTGDVAEHVSEIALYGLAPDYFERYGERVLGVTPADVLAAAQRWLRPEEVVVVVAGDASATAGELETLGMGAVHVRDSA
jgi:zinc protease